MIRKHFWWILCATLLFSITIISWRPVGNTTSAAGVKTPPTAKELFEQYVNTIYQTAKLQQAGLDFSVFQKAVTGYINLKLANKLPQNSSVITVVDFTQSSRQKRMWIVDILAKQLLLNTWVAHGQGSGDDMANQFSDNNESHQSSLGFYLTDDVYMGKHGKSLRLDGLDEGFNRNARTRDIVVHAADYVGETAIEKMGRLGRSFGCPAVAPEVRDFVIDAIKGKTVMFINGNNTSYTSKYLDETNLTAFVPDTTGFAFTASLKQ
jgi:hypothetical protein